MEILLLDTQGLYCPEPVMLLHKQIRQAEQGQCIRILATDPSTQRDIPKFCHFLAHELLESDEQQGVYSYLIRKA